MRIHYDHQVFSLQNAGGASRYHYELMQYLCTISDVRLDLVLGTSATILPFSRLPRTQARVFKLRHTLQPGLARYLANELFENVIALGRERADVYHPTLYRCVPMVRARCMVVTHHDCVHERYPHLFPGIKRVLNAKKKQFAQADAIICVSESSRKDLLDFYQIDPSKTVVVHHGVNRLPRSLDARVQLKKHVQRGFLLFVGSRAPYKNFDNLLEAFHESRLYQSMDLLVLGGGPLTVKEADLATKLGVAKNVIVIPEASDTLLAEAYADAQLLVYPSLCEGFGFPPLEAMALGCVVLVSNTSSLPEVCRDAPFYFDQHDRNALAPALIRAATDRVARDQMIRRGTWVAGQYSWDKCGQETLALYRECL
jgi:glycosyltransferase involved in cell wall biosynthesis